MRRAIYRAALGLGLDRWLRWRRAGGLVLCYHNVVAPGEVPPGDPALHLPLDAFESQLDFLQRHFAAIPLEELLARLRAGRSLRGTVAITFDDGYRGALRYALPAMRRRTIPAALFVTSVGARIGSTFWWDWPSPGVDAERPGLRDVLLNQCQGDAAQIAQRLELQPVEAMPSLQPARWSELREAAGADVTFGSHSVSHRNLAALSDAEIDNELLTNIDDIERELGRRPVAVAYPYGSWSPRVAARAAAIGLQLGFTLDSRDVAASTSPLSVPRVNLPSSISQAAFALWASGLAAMRA